MAIARSSRVVTSPVSTAENVWSALCRTALRGIEWATDACGSEDALERVERAELLLEHGLFAQVPASGNHPIDWAKLIENERSRVALTAGPAARGKARAD